MEFCQIYQHIIFNNLIPNLDLYVKFFQDKLDQSILPSFLLFSINFLYHLIMCNSLQYNN